MSVSLPNAINNPQNDSSLHKEPIGAITHTNVKNRGALQGVQNSKASQ